MLTIKIPSILFAEIEKEKKKQNWIHMDQQKSRTTKVLLSKSNKLCTSHFLLSEYHGKVTTFKLQPNRKQESHVGQRNWVEPRKRAAHLLPTDSWWGGNQRGRGHSFSGWHWENSIYVFTPMNASETLHYQQIPPSWIRRPDTTWPLDGGKLDIAWAGAFL